ncbi:MAG: Coenzyme F420 hydrogenase/dehydrogenase, beta subunit C-terminal domain [Ruminococcus sp.]|nr:Coenzyme F420 hydrogenase/dehydrogenase, beta subunit C-terminal domain [Ruminococcus sp.]
MKNEVNNTNKTLGVYAAYNNDNTICMNSSSGGVFWPIAKCIISKGGIVYGAMYEKPFDVFHGRADTLDKCEAFRKSKYLQSQMGECYNAVKEDLANGKYVLFSGTPCQVAALYKCIGTQRSPNLVTTEVVCHGVPSQLVYKKYIEYLEKKYNSRIISTCWRDKRGGFGWNPNHISFELKNNKRICTTSEKNDFQFGFLRNFYLRESCYHCKYAKLPRIADITLADFWGYTGELLEKNENMGISAVIVSSLQGQKVWNEIKQELNYHTVELDYLKDRSRHVWIHPEENPKRMRLMKNIENKSWSMINREMRGNYLYRAIRHIYHIIMH